jgi:DNA-binding transcriptional LysR family regulator
MSDLVEFRHLKYIVAVAEEANFTRAAERLFLAQPSLSKQIKDLEDVIGFPIFVRSRDGARITPGGQMMVQYAQEALQARAQMVEIARSVNNGELPALRLGFSSFINPNLLEHFRNSYSRLFPDCRIHLSGGDPANILQRLKVGSLDGAFLPMPVDGADWVVVEVSRDSYVVCMRADDPLTVETEVHIADLAHRLKIFRDPETHASAHQRLTAMLIAAGINPEVSCVAATPADVQWMIRAGYGLALVDRTAVLDAGLTTRPISGIEWTSDTAFVHHKRADHLALPFVIRFLQQMRKSTPEKLAAPSKAERQIQLNLPA